MSTREILFIPTDHLDFPILNDFITIEDLISISMLNKHLNCIAKKQLRKIKLFIEKLEGVVILKNHSSLYSSSYLNFGEKNNTNNLISNDLQNNRREILPYLNEKKNQYNPLYWYKYFGKKLNSQELALYYAYFILNYHIPSGLTERSTIDPKIMISKWNCVSFEDGFIKLLAGSDNSISMSRDKEHYIFISKRTKIEFLNKNNDSPPKSYINIHGHINSQYDLEFDYMSSFPEYIFSIDTELLKNIYSFIKNSKCVYNENEINYTYPSIKNAITNIYPIFRYI
jgi:hypothetical protein